MDRNKSSILKDVLKVIVGLVSAPLIVVLIMILLVWIAGYGRVYETTNIEKYGRIKGNFDNDRPREFIFSFFPEEIEDDFSDISYLYKAKKGDAYAYECYLEFVIEDTAAYNAFVEKHIERSESVPFLYDEAFYEQSVSNVFDIDHPITAEGAYSIGTAELGKILYSDQQQRIIFVALGMFDGGGATTAELGHFFSRFHIDPAEYAKTAYGTGYYQEQGITNEEFWSDAGKPVPWA